MTPNELVHTPVGWCCFIRWEWSQWATCGGRLLTVRYAVVEDEQGHRHAFRHDELEREAPARV